MHPHSPRARAQRLEGNSRYELSGSIEEVTQDLSILFGMTEPRSNAKFILFGFGALLGGGILGVVFSATFRLVTDEDGTLVLVLVAGLGLALALGLWLRAAFAPVNFLLEDAHIRQADAAVRSLELPPGAPIRVALSAQISSERRQLHAEGGGQVYRHPWFTLELTLPTGA